MSNERNSDVPVEDFIASLDEQEKLVLKDYIGIPNNPDIQPEMLRLRAQHGELLGSVTGKVEQLRQQVRCDYDTIQQQISEALG